MTFQPPSAARARLDRLDAIGAHLATRGDVIALLGLGSVGVEHDRLDEHSDLDFFIVVDDGAKQRYIDSIDWLEHAHHVAYSFVNDPNGRKALFADGIFVEYAVFTLEQLDDIPFTGARVVWARDDAPDDLPERGRRAGRPFLDTVEFHLNEALTNLFVGMHRELRGERTDSDQIHPVVGGRPSARAASADPVRVVDGPRSLRRHPTDRAGVLA